MSGTKLGAQRARETMLKKLGKEQYDAFHKRIGAKGGRNGRGPNYAGGFSSQGVDSNGLTGSERARVAGRKGGLKSTRKGIKNGCGKKANRDIDTLEQLLAEEAEDGRD